MEYLTLCIVPSQGEDEHEARNWCGRCTKASSLVLAYLVHGWKNNAPSAFFLPNCPKWKPQFLEQKRLVALIATSACKVKYDFHSVPWQLFWGWGMFTLWGGNLSDNNISKILSLRGRQWVLLFFIRPRLSENLEFKNYIFFDFLHFWYKSDILYSPSRFDCTIAADGSIFVSTLHICVFDANTAWKPDAILSRHR